LVSLLIRGFVNPKVGKKGGGVNTVHILIQEALKLILSILAQGSKDSSALYAAADKDKRIKNNRQLQGIWVYLFHHYNI
jgi:hypothetical protein